MDDQPAERLLRVGDREQLAAAARLAQHAAGRRPGRRPRRRTASGRGRPRPRRGRSARRTPSRRAGSRRPGPRRWSSRSRGTRCRRRAPGSPRTGRPARRASRAGPSCPDRLRSRCSARARSEPARSTRDAVLGRQLDRQVDREAVGVVEPEGDLAGEDRRVRRDVLRAAADDPLRVGQVSGMSASSRSFVPASRVRANWVSSRVIAARISSRLGSRCG